MKKLNFIGSVETIQVIKKNTLNSEKEKFELLTADRHSINKRMTNVALKKRKEEQVKFLDKLLQNYKILESRQNKTIMLGVIENQTAEIVS